MLETLNLSYTSLLRNNASAREITRFVGLNCMGRKVTQPLIHFFANCQIGDHMGQEKMCDLYRSVVMWLELPISSVPHFHMLSDIPSVYHEIRGTFRVGSISYTPQLGFVLHYSYFFTFTIPPKPKGKGMKTRGVTLSVSTAKRAWTSVRWRQVAVPRTQALDEAVTEDEPVSNQDSVSY